MTPQTVTYQASQSLGFSRQEYWSGLPFPSPMHESKKFLMKVAQSCPTLSDPIDCSPPGSSVPGIFQARVLEWGAIAFSLDLLDYSEVTSKVTVIHIPSLGATLRLLRSISCVAFEFGKKYTTVS